MMAAMVVVVVVVGAAIVEVRAQVVENVELWVEQDWERGYASIHPVQMRLAVEKRQLMRCHLVGEWI